MKRRRLRRWREKMRGSPPNGLDGVIGSKKRGPSGPPLNRAAHSMPRSSHREADAIFPNTKGDMNSDWLGARCHGLGSSDCVEGALGRLEPSASCASAMRCCQAEINGASALKVWVRGYSVSRI
jgi:hypothetical protein